MAFARVTHTCGHTSRVQGVNRTDADRYAARKSQELCWDCKKAEEAKAVAAANAVDGLPALTGSDKQIAWAEALRRRQIADLTATIADIQTDEMPQVPPELRPELVDACTIMLATIRAETSAHAIIERRTLRLTEARDVLQYMARQGWLPTLSIVFPSISE